MNYILIRTCTYTQPLNCWEEGGFLVWNENGRNRLFICGFISGRIFAELAHSGGDLKIEKQFRLVIQLNCWWKLISRKYSRMAGYQDMGLCVVIHSAKSFCQNKHCNGAFCQTRILPFYDIRRGLPFDKWSSFWMNFISKWSQPFGSKYPKKICMKLFNA